MLFAYCEWTTIAHLSLSTSTGRFIYHYPFLFKHSEVGQLGVPGDQQTWLNGRLIKHFFEVPSESSSLTCDEKVGGSNVNTDVFSRKSTPRYTSG